jgi:drug/metabolite transporter (DMT)-like permease
MTPVELALCLSAVATSSLSQLCLKAASKGKVSHRGLLLTATAITLQALSVLMTVLVLRSVPLSRLTIFAAGAYVLVPLGSRLVFGDRLTPRFWVGACLIALGVAWSHA